MNKPPSRFLIFFFTLGTITLATYLVLYWLNQPRPSFDQIPQITPSPAQSQPCAGTEQFALQRCCQEWADLHNLMTIQCVGEWYLDSGNCAYRCTTSEIINELTPH